MPMYDTTSLIQAGIPQSKNETIERYMWTNLPFGLTQDIIERVLFFNKEISLDDLLAQ